MKRKNNSKTKALTIQVHELPARSPLVKTEAEALEQSIDNRVVNLNRFHLKICNYDNNTFQELERRLLSFSKVLGITNVPSPEDIQVIVMFLKTHFDDLSMEEIGFAFELYCTLKLPVNIESFNSFNIRFVARILIAFRKYREQEMKKFRQLEDAQEEERLKHERMKMTDEQIRDEADQSNKSWYDNLLLYIRTERKMPLGWNYNAVFLHLVKIGKVTIDEEQINELRERITKEMQLEELEEVTRNTRLTSIRELTGSTVRSSSDPKTVSFRMRKEYVINYIKQLNDGQ